MNSLSSVLADPQGPRHWVERLALVDQIGHPDHGTMARFTVLMAPFGYGKTTLIAQWVRHVQDQTYLAICDQRSLTQDPATMLPMATLLHELIRDLDAGFDGSSSLVALFRWVREAGRPCVVVFDDFDAISQATQESLLNGILLHPNSPENLRVITNCRKPIHRPIGILVARNWTRFLTQTHFEYRDTEIVQVHPAVDDDPDRAELPTLVEISAARWPAGVHILSHLMPSHLDASHWHALEDYLSERMDASLDPATRALLLATCDIPEFSTELWDVVAKDLAITPIPLEDVLAIVPSHRIESRSSDYRFVPVVRTCLQRLSNRDQAVRRQANAIALAWMIKHRRYREAIELGIATDRWADVAEALIPICLDFSIRNYDLEVLEILDIVPTSHLLESLDLAIRKIYSLICIGRVVEARELFERMPPGWHTKDSLSAGRYLVISSAFLNQAYRFDEALAANYEALEILPASAHHERMTQAVCVEFGEALKGNAQLEAKYAEVAQSERDALPRDQRWWHFYALPSRIDRIIMTGDLIAARQMCDHQLKSLPEELHPYNSILTMRLALLDLEQGHINEALARMEAISTPPRETYWAMFHAVARAEVLHEIGRSDDAASSLYEAIQQADHERSALDIIQIRALLADMWLDRGYIALADAWAKEYVRGKSAWRMTISHITPDLVLARLRLAQEDWNGAIALLNEIIAEGERRKQWAPLVRAYSLLAVAYTRLGDIVRSHAAITKAIRIGSPGGFHRSFILNGVDLRNMAHSPNMASSVHVRKDQNGPQPKLTDRELDVLRLVAQGLSNPEIATRLFISRFTVKNHLSNIYTALAVKNRRDSVILARTLGLI